MADEGAHWSFQLVDGITSASNKMAEAVKSLEATMKRTDGAIKGTEEGTAKHTESTYAKMKESAKSFAEGFFFVTEDIEKGAEFIEGAFDKIKEAAEYVFDVSDFRRNALIGLDAMVSTGYQATEVLEKLEGWAKQTGFAKDTFVTFGRQLLGAGFKEGELKPLLAGLSDVQAVNGGQVAASQELLSQIMRIKSLDKVNSRELAALGGLGITPEKIYEVLAAQRKITIKQAKALFDESSGGGLKGTDAINAILGAVSKGIDKGGPLGKAGQDWALGSIPAQAQKAKDALSGMFDKVDTTKFAAAIGRVTAQLTGDEGERFAKGISSAFDKVAGFVSKLDFDKIGLAIDQLGDGLEQFSEFLGDVFSGLSDGWNDMKGTIEGLGGVLGTIFGSEGTSGVRMFVESIMDVIGAVVVVGEVIGVAVGLIVTGFVAVVEGIAWCIGELIDGAAFAIKAVEAFFAPFNTFGEALVNGLWEGIKAGWAGLISGFHELINMLPASVKHVLGIASPSRVFAGLGVQTMAGFTEGLETVNVHEHMVRQVTPPRGLGDIGGGLELGSFRPNARNVNDFGPAAGAGVPAPRIDFRAELHFDGSKDPQATAEAAVGEMRRVFLPELATALEQLANEMGA